uniref:ribose-phosphate diphosphokinase n=1 Tax=Trypanosoma vivax (strain Y486) TaxID=1055687 RepID=G0TVR3_TRYVY|nr:putative phosphoribosylpyrophosphate synthetase [Trypanosoma vivax Y486]
MSVTHSGVAAGDKTVLCQHLTDIENAYYYDSGKSMTAVHPADGTVSPRRGKDMGSVCIVAGNGNRPLAEAVALLMGIPTHNTTVTQRANGEVNVRICESVLGADVYIIQSTSGNGLIDVNTALMELLLLIRKMRLSNAKRVTAIITYFAYSRQDRKHSVRGPISAAAVAQMLTTAGVDRVTTVDLHSGQIQGFFGNVPLDNLLLYREFAQYFSGKPWFNRDNMSIVALSAGSVKRARLLADTLHIERIATIMRRSNAAGLITLQTVGEVEGLICIVVSGVCDTGEELIRASELLKSQGAAKVVGCCTHGIMTPPCTQRLNGCEELEELVVSDSIPQEEHMKLVPKLKVLTIAPLIASVVLKYMQDASLCPLFDAPTDTV